MRWDILICVAILPLLPLLNTLLIRWRFHLRGYAMTKLQMAVLLLILLIIGLTFSNILWIVLGILSGIFQAIFTATTLNEGLRLGFVRAIPLDQNQDLLPWGLLPPLLVGIGVNIIAHLICMRKIKLTTYAELSANNASASNKSAEPQASTRA